MLAFLSLSLCVRARACVCVFVRACKSHFSRRVDRCCNVGMLHDEGRRQLNDVERIKPTALPQGFHTFQHDILRSSAEGVRTARDNSRLLDACDERS